ncbi:hypothetical protein ECANGB1_2615 [Enterospora canceri]|uniref:Uncharacterized protein n=1 Tax=Enterospora canceri TaxID=1081671 RepID=A0A1Y1S9J3_9MICR|nr:hypothetical protein ECANGB1_2615 [Enterospora canceri]
MLFVLVQLLDVSILPSRLMFIGTRSVVASSCVIIFSKEMKFSPSMKPTSRWLSNTNFMNTHITSSFSHVSSLSVSSEFESHLYFLNPAITFLSFLI